MAGTERLDLGGRSRKWREIGCVQCGTEGKGLRVWGRAER